MTTMTTPHPSEIRAARLAAALSQAEAARCVWTTERTWQRWEAGERAMSCAAWELFLLKTHQPHRLA